MGFFIEVEPSSTEFKEVTNNFRKMWSSEKGACPNVRKVLAIVNPSLECAYQEYEKSLPSKMFWQSKSRKCFHGTNYKCALELYLTPCQNSACGICGISTTGFQKHCIRARFQRYGNGFYFAPNSSKSHDYCSKPDAARCNAMLLCQVAIGKSYTTRTNMRELEGPPKNHHSVHGKRKSILSKSELNYDEIVVYSSAAICPRYVLLYDCIRESCI